MTIITAPELIRRSDDELGALFHSFNLAIVRTYQNWQAQIAAGHCRPQASLSRVGVSSFCLEN